MSKVVKELSKKSAKKSKESSGNRRSKVSPSRKSRPSFVDDKSRTSSVPDDGKGPPLDSNAVVAYRRATGSTPSSHRKSADSKKKKSADMSSRKTSGSRKLSIMGNVDPGSGFSPSAAESQRSKGSESKSEAKKTLMQRMFTTATTDHVSTVEKSDRDDSKKTTKSSRSVSASKLASSKNSSLKRGGSSVNRQSAGGGSEGVPLTESPLGKTIYQFTVRTLRGETVSMDRYVGKTLIVVNIASQDATLSKKNLGPLNQLFINYQSNGLRIAAFPSNDFGGEPLDDRAIEDFVKKHEILFQVYAKISLRGDPLFTWLAQTKTLGCSGPGGSKSPTNSSIGTDRSTVDTLKNNYTKFLVDRHGYLFRVYQPSDDPFLMESDIKALLC